MAVSREWLEWTRSRARSGTPVAELREALRTEGFSDRDIKFALKKALPAEQYRREVRSPAAGKARGASGPVTTYEALANPRLVREVDGERIVSLCDGDVQLYTLPKFLDAAQCASLIDTIRAHAHPSRVDGYSRESEMRSSSTCALGVRDHPGVAELDEMISRVLGLSLGWSEINQGQWYEPGQQYRPHPDYFPPGTPEFDRFARTRGQRTWTFMIYLNEPERGGGTHFTRIDRTLMPERGRAVCWNNLLPNGQPNPRTLHAGLPVEAGSKFIITKWFRDRGHGPPFVD